MTPLQFYRSNNDFCMSLGTKAVIVCLLVPVSRMLLESSSVRGLLEILPACLADDGLGCRILRETHQQVAINLGLRCLRSSAEMLGLCCCLWQRARACLQLLLRCPS
jgi:hypothetical protein